ncbi:DNA internalization-related competence protein ComEC/Rec2 [Sporolactobacillus sp. CPB3-1]|uniref:DNA internalization-related competence protein ComEC/Rec2 n=1 Tax=Sporolactobacillus mangiferae TaxID=2940498 RepID=A0ABT0M6E3_9BACL|nr:DNA internalization-related competence protein ComEC/Rec2 [Sporolactobacillus mangiferae]MCL1630435.1 DNA internalization-related competence protein ComEC/Rec2 [Sporolactobacillus mangiferae]
MIRFFGRWHILALSGCLAAWMLQNLHSLVPALLYGAFGLFLLWRRQFLLLSAAALLLVVTIIDIVYVQTNESLLSEGQRELNGRISGIPDFDGDHLRFQLKTEQGEDVLVEMRLVTELQKHTLMRDLKVGMACKVKGTLEKPERPGNFHGFDQKMYLERHHIYWILTLSSAPVYSETEQSPVEHIQRFQQEQIQFIHEHFTLTTAEMMNALLFGYDSQMSDELIDAYRMFGLVHLLVVSGMHIAVVFGALFYIFRRASIAREHALLLMLLLIPGYVVMTGSEPSIIRAGVTSGCLILSSWIKAIHLTVTDAISIACLLMVLFDPKIIYDLGFQLSFVVTLAVVLASKAVRSYKSLIVRMVVLSLICELATFPIIVSHFYQLSLAGIVLSIFFVPFITFIIFPLCVAAYFISLFFTELTPFLSYLIDSVLYWPHRLLFYLSQHPPLQLNYGALTGWEICVSILIIYSSLIVWEHYHNNRSIFILLVPFVFVYAMLFVSDRLDAHGSVTFLNVGQGDSIFIQFPYKKAAMLIDTGGTIMFNQEEKWRQRRKSFEVGRDVVARELLAERIGRLDAVVLTHRDYDHIGGLKGLTDQIPVSQLFVSPYHDPDAKDQALFRDLIKRGTRIAQLRSGMSLKFNETTFHVVAPEERSKESNDNSIVLHTELGGEQWLFTGDLSQDGEKRMLQAFPSIKADVLKLGHHGSRTSTSEEMLIRLQPKIGIISCGRRNRYGHPHPEVLQLLRAYHVRNLRTDQNGAIRFHFDRKRIIGWEQPRAP